MTKKMTYEEFLVKLKSDSLTTAKGNCPAEQILKAFQGKWKDEILYCLCIYETVRFGKLKKLLKGVTNTTLTAALRDLEKDGFIKREQFNEIPPRVEYSFTQKGRDLTPVFYEMAMWGMKYADENKESA
ncbi:MAG: helix-turn-helix transcriptional regulator [Alphaproteobacteria bacterium]|nr:helix-turn-helix transcriptional regulator [Alphaproteobacteria bacterium]